MTTSSYLGGQSGVQYNGIETDIGGYPKFSLQNALLVGEFKRGPFHKPFKVTKETMEAQLSYDYANPYYIALEDAFKTGAEYVWVMRVEATVYVWGEWQISASIAIQNNKIRYTAYKTNGKVTFDSFAEVDLVQAIVHSLHDSNMQQWQAVKDACNELTGVTDWTVDTANEQVVYADPSSISSIQYIWSYNGNVSAPYFNTPELACRALYAITGKTYGGSRQKEGQPSIYTCEATSFYGNYDSSEVYRKANPDYDPTIKKYIHFSNVAQKIISNASSSNQAISLLAETYIEAVAKSIFNSDESKQFVKLADLIPQFEANKTQR